MNETWLYDLGLPSAAFQHGNQIFFTDPDLVTLAGGWGVLAGSSGTLFFGEKH